MSSVHRIRLQGPWEVILNGEDAGDSSPVPIQVPICWRDLFGDQDGTARFVRPFNAPTNLDPGDRLFVVVPEESGEIRSLLLNGVEQGADPAFPLRFEVTNSLRDFNRLEIVLHADPATLPEGRGGLWQPVILEIHSDLTDR